MLKSNLFDELMTIHNSFENAFNRFFSNSQLRPALVATETTWIPAAEAFLKDDVMTLRVFLPGVDEQKISLELKDSVLIVSGERVPVQSNQDARVLLNELPYGKFERHIALPEEVLADDQKCMATFHDGVLEITLPVVSQYLRSRRIPIETVKEQKQIASA
jgi:HSP20 family molecular chaperone IbpA